LAARFLRSPVSYVLAKPPQGAAGCVGGEDPVRTGGPAQEPAATARVRRDAGNVKRAACDDVRQPVDARGEPGLEVLTSRLDLVAQPGQCLGVGVRPGIGRILDRLEPGPIDGLALLQLAYEPGEGPAGQFGCQVRDAVAQA